VVDCLDASGRSDRYRGRTVLIGRLAAITSSCSAMAPTKE